MVVPLLQTKLYIPPPRRELVPRPRLLERLNKGLWQNGPREGGLPEGLGFARKLILISASAGSGKTTLLSAWAVGCGQLELPVRVAWLSLDQEDNDPTRFLAYVISSLQTIYPGFG
jgi:LuxR family maltose regulon positive regulatory protein